MIKLRGCSEDYKTTLGDIIIHHKHQFFANTRAKKPPTTLRDLYFFF